MARFKREAKPRRERNFTGNPKRKGDKKSNRNYDNKRGITKSRFSDRRRDLEMTKVTCASCRQECEVPFKPTSSKPVYCRDCFSKQDTPKRPNSNLDEINTKLDKIMRALKIE